MYPVTTLKSDLTFDKLLIKKLNCEVDVPVEERVFALAQAGICDDSFYARIQSFECHPKDVSLTLVLQKGDMRVVATADEQENASLTVNGEPMTEKMTSYLIAGEDLQGEYWGAVFVLPLALLEQALGCPLTVGQQLEGNFIRDGKFQSHAFPIAGKLVIE